MHFAVPYLNMRLCVHALFALQLIQIPDSWSWSSQQSKWQRVSSFCWIPTSTGRFPKRKKQCISCWDNINTIVGSFSNKSAISGSIDTVTIISRWDKIFQPVADLDGIIISSIFESPNLKPTFYNILIDGKRNWSVECRFHRKKNIFRFLLFSPCEVKTSMPFALPFDSYLQARQTISYGKILLYSINEDCICMSGDIRPFIRARKF